jgi:hypothetical protein
MNHKFTNFVLKIFSYFSGLTKPEQLLLGPQVPEIDVKIRSKNMARAGHTRDMTNLEHFRF